MKLKYVIAFIFINAHATQYWPLPKPIVVKVEVKKNLEDPQNEQIASRRSYDSEQPQAVTMEKEKTEEYKCTVLRNRKESPFQSALQQKKANVSSKRINETRSLGLFSLFSCSSQPDE